MSSDDAELWGARDEDDDVYDSHSVGHLSTGGVSSSDPHSSTVLPAPPHSTSTPASTSTTTTSTVQRHRRSSSPPAAATASSHRSPSRRSSSHSVRGAPTRSVSPITTPLLEPVEAVALDQPSHTVEGPRMSIPLQPSVNTQPTTGNTSAEGGYNLRGRKSVDYTEQHIDKIGYRQPNAPDASLTHQMRR